MKITYFKIHLIVGALLRYITNIRATTAHYIRKISGYSSIRLLASYFFLTYCKIQISTKEKGKCLNTLLFI
jgi:hypothetical protein